jgi:hypothetical protein
VSAVFSSSLGFEIHVGVKAAGFEHGIAFSNWQQPRDNA